MARPETLPAADVRPLVMHVVYRFDTGGLENGIVNLINHMPPQAYRHMVVALTEVTDFSRRLRVPDVQCVALHKPPGHGAKVYPAFWRLLRQHRPAVVHTRNLAALEMQAVAWAARVPARIHGEHGRDVDDLDGQSLRHQRIRRLYARFVPSFVALSQDLAGYLQHRVGLAPQRIAQIYNGVDTARFSPPAGLPVQPMEGCPFDPQRHWLIGSVGRMHPVKNPQLLARAFVALLQRAPQLRERARLVMIGEGGERALCRALLDQAGLSDLAWLPGERSDVPDVMRGLHVFVLPSLAEGISNTILEAQASGRALVATQVGGNGELVSDGETGLLVPSDDAAAMAAALQRLHDEPGLAQRLGTAGREDVLRRFSLQAMVARYQGLYDQRLGRA